MRLLVSGQQKVASSFAENGQPVKFETVNLPSSNAEREASLSALIRERPFLLLGKREDVATIMKRLNAGIIIFDARIIKLDVPKPRIILAGIHKFEDEQDVNLLKDAHVYSMQLLHDDSQSACDAMMEIAKEWPLCFILISLNVLDPVFAQVPNPAYGGMTTRQLLYFVQRLRMLKNFCGAAIIDYEKAMPVAEKLLSELAVR